MQVAPADAAALFQSIGADLWAGLSSHGLDASNASRRGAALSAAAAAAAAAVGANVQQGAEQAATAPGDVLGSDRVSLFKLNVSSG